ncbi:MAG: AMP-binding protein, partial [Acidimicrobiia bacterium]|nr:AMP-binding protein [Acidimicrobiia bacterium]
MATDSTDEDAADARVAAIENLSTEDRTFPPPAGFRERSLVAGPFLYDEAAIDDEGFWARQAADLLDWDRDWDTILDWQPPFAKWFVGGQLNVCRNAVDRHVDAGRGDVVAYHWEGEPGDTRTVTYADLLDEVQRAANALKGLGVERGDRVAIYMPMIPELPVAMLACARIGAAHSVVFGGFSPDALADRINDAGCRVVITADGGFRRGAPSLLKPNVDLAVTHCPTMEHVLVVRRVTDHPHSPEGTAVEMVDGRDQWWHDLVGAAAPDCPAEPMDAEQLLYLLYTSGTTAKPKGIMHTTGGYLTQVAFTHRYVFDQQDDDVYWCAADIGWVTGHSYIVYGPLTNGVTSVMYEGTPDTQTADKGGREHGRDRWWDIIERYGVTTLYAAPTAIRTFMKWGRAEPDGHELSSLRLLGSVGEPINPEAWIW